MGVEVGGLNTSVFSGSKGVAISQPLITCERGVAVPRYFLMLGLVDWLPGLGRGVGGGVVTG